MQSVLILAASVITFAGPLFATAAEKVDYVKQIKPLLKQHCVSCHGPLRQKGGLRVDAAKLILKGGDSGTANVPRKPDDSLLLAVLTGKGGYTRMPLKGKPLKPAEIALIRRWILEGAKAPVDEKLEPSPRDHWAYRLPKRPAVPTPRNRNWIRNPIDAFLAVQHEKRGLKPQTPAAKHILLRRVSLDLIGLPPTAKEVRAFANDKSPTAYEKVVDRLLKSPRYGERWGRHWMDVWRYSDWYGYRAELRSSARHIWRWRDYIVESLNKDRPYNEMIVDMLAADENSPTDRDRLRATGFLARHYYKFNRDVWLDGAIEHTGKAFLGLTFNCARCHEHKYDPIDHRDYYELRAIFEPYRVRTERVSGEPNIMKNGLTIAYDANSDAKTYVYERGNDKYPDKKNPCLPALPDFLTNGRLEIQSVKLPPAAWYPGMRPQIRRELLQKLESQIRIRQAVLKKAELALRSTQRRRKKVGQKPVVAPKPRPRKPRLITEAKPVLYDDFSSPQPKLWTVGPGKWANRDGKLIQTKIAKSRQFVQSKQNHPQDFTVVFQFRTTGGGLYKSVGLSFDADGKGNSVGVYLSAYAAGPKLQVALHHRGKPTAYPRNGRKSMPVKVGEKQELRVDVRGRLLNVAVNGKRKLVYVLPVVRRSGKLALWTFDATAEFLNVAVRPLSKGVKLAGTVRGLPFGINANDPADAVKRAELSHRAAIANVTAAESALASLRARIAADDARYADTPHKDAKRLIAAAGRAEKLANLHSAQAAVLTAQAAGARPKIVRRKKKLRKRKLSGRINLAAARKRLAAAQKALKADDGKYTPISEVYPQTSTGRRLALAKSIANKRNPLTARVAVNHIWMRHFGRPLVSTTFDFGLKGTPATHPQLLDWLAAEFMNNGWKMKPLHRLIVMSNAYRMSSSTRAAAPVNFTADKDNAFLWRMNSRRMESEIVRDTVLFVAGQLDTTMGGPELDAKLGQTTRRRSIYYRHAPEKFMSFLQIFDGASTHECYRRNETVVPQQSLAMINSSLLIEQSRRMTALLNRIVKGDGEFVDRLFLRILSRKPTANEWKTCVAFLAEQTERLKKAGKLSTFAGGPTVKTPPSTIPRIRSRENLALVMVNHNEFITIR